VTTAILILAILATTFAVMFALDRLEQRTRRRDRHNIRMLHTYMSKLPPARPW
jgi:hypothetical protein